MSSTIHFRRSKTQRKEAYCRSEAELPDYRLCRVGVVLCRPPSCCYLHPTLVAQCQLAARHPLFLDTSLYVKERKGLIADVGPGKKEMCSKKILTQNSFMMQSA